MDDTQPYDDHHAMYAQEEGASATAESANEAEWLAEEERTREDLWHDIYQAVRNARRYLITEREIQRAVTEALQ